MEQNIYFSICVLLITLCQSDSSDAGKTVFLQTYKNYFSVTWAYPRDLPESWSVSYQVMGTSYHSVIQLPSNQSSANISTGEYPGVMFMIHVYKQNNHTQTLFGTVFGRSDCSERVNTTIGTTYTVKSYGYLSRLTPGSLCTWSLFGNNDTWYKAKLVDFDLGNVDTCDSYLTIGDLKICKKSDANATLVLKSSSTMIKLFTRQPNGGRGLFMNISAVHKLEAPENVSVSQTNNHILIAWDKPPYHPQIFHYVIRLAHFPFQSHIDIPVAGNATGYELTLQGHFGQNYTVQIKSQSEDLDSPFSDLSVVTTSCNRTVFIKATEWTTFTTEQYPHTYLPGLTCYYTFYTDTEFILRVTSNDLNIDGGSLCNKDFLEVGNHGRFCTDRLPARDILINSSNFDMVFHSGKHVNGSGVNLTVYSVPRPPPPPRHVHTVVTGAGIVLAWQPPQIPEDYITNYYIQYFIPPSPGATVKVGQSVHNFTIDTTNNAGRLYVIRMSASTAGGKSKPTEPLYVRARCGNELHLSRHQTGVVFSPLNKPHYPPGVFCTWNITAESPLWIRVNVDNFALEHSVNCSKDYVDITDAGRVCGDGFFSATENTFLLKQTFVGVIFRSDFDTEAAGFQLSFTAVGPTPGVPENVTMVVSQYSIIVQWNPPTFNRHYLQAYNVRCKTPGDLSDIPVTVRSDLQYHVIDTTSRPGKLIDISVQSVGDFNNSESVQITECGGIEQISDQPRFISSPNIATRPSTSIYCAWKIHAQEFLIEFLRINLENDMVNGSNSCNNFLKLGNVTYCDDSIEGSIIKIDDSDILLEFQTSDRGRGSFFVLKITPAKDGDIIIDSSDALSSSFFPLRSSPPILYTSYISALLVSTFLTSLTSYSTKLDSTFTHADILTRTDHRQNTDEGTIQVTPAATSLSSHFRPTTFYSGTSINTHPPLYNIQPTKAWTLQTAALQASIAPTSTNLSTLSLSEYDTTTVVNGTSQNYASCSKRQTVNDTIEIQLKTGTVPLQSVYSIMNSTAMQALFVDSNTNYSERSTRSSNPVEQEVSSSQPCSTGSKHSTVKHRSVVFFTRSTLEGSAVDFKLHKSTGSFQTVDWLQSSMELIQIPTMWSTSLKTETLNSSETLFMTSSYSFSVHRTCNMFFLLISILILR